jgi:hypothetical protein
MELTETGLNIPLEFKRLTVKKAYEIMGISKTTDEQGKKFIAFSELHRVFGEEALKKLWDYSQTEGIPNIGNAQMDAIGKVGTQKTPFGTLELPTNPMSLMLENTKLTEQVKALQERLNDREERLQEKDLLLSRQDRQIVVSRILEIICINMHN